jgi:N-formylglutamate deformylase
MSTVASCCGRAIRSAAACVSCAPSLQHRLQQRLQAQSRFTFAVNGRFKGGYITRHYGQPDAGVHAVQLELSQINYMNEESFAYDAEKAAPVQHLIAGLLEEALA